LYIVSGQLFLIYSASFEHKKVT